MRNIQFLCKECREDFDDISGTYSETVISKKSIEDLENKIEKLGEELEENKNKIANLISNKNQELIKMVKKSTNILIEVVEKASSDFIEKIENDTESNFLTNYENYIEKLDGLKYFLEDEGQTFSIESEIARDYIKNNYKILKDFSKEKFKEDQKLLKSFKLNEEMINTDTLKHENYPLIEKIYENIFSMFTDFLKGYKDDFCISPLIFQENILYKGCCQFRNYFGLKQINDNELNKLLYPLHNDFNYDLLKLSAHQYIKSQNKLFLSLFPYSPGFFYHDPALYSFDKAHILIITQIILQRAFGNNFLSFDPNTILEGKMSSSSLQMIYANRTIKNFTFDLNYGKDQNNINAIYSNNFLRVQAKFNSRMRNISQNIYIFLDDYSILFDSKSNNYFYYNNNKNWENISVNEEIKNLLYSNIQQNLNLASVRLQSGNNSILKTLPCLNDLVYNKKDLVKMNKKGDEKANNYKQFKKNNSISRENNEKIKIDKDIFKNERNPWKMVDNHKTKLLLNNIKNIELKNETEKNIFSQIIKKIFKDKFLYITKSQEGRFLGLFMIINNNGLFEISKFEEINFNYGYEITCNMLINGNVEEIKLFFIKKGFRLLRPIKVRNDNQEECYFLNNNTNEASGMEEIQLPEILNNDLNTFLSKEYQEKLNKKYESEEDLNIEIENLLKLMFMREKISSNKKKVYSFVLKELVQFLNRTHNIDIIKQNKIKVSQINEYNIDLNKIKQKLKDYYKNNIGKIQDENNSSELDILNFHLKSLRFKLDSNGDLINNNINSYSFFKNIFIEKNLNNKLLKVDLIFNSETEVCSIFFFVDLSGITIDKKKKKINLDLIKDDEINLSNIKIYLFEPLKEIQIFRYKKNGENKSIIQYSPNYYSLKKILDNEEEQKLRIVKEEKIKEEKINEEKIRVEKIKTSINSKEYLEKIENESNCTNYRELLSKIAKENEIDGNQNQFIPEEKKINIIAQLYYENLNQNKESEKIKITANINYIDIKGHLKNKSLTDEIIIEKEILQEDNLNKKIYFTDQELFPIFEIKNIHTSEKEIEVLDERIRKNLTEKMIKRCQELETKPLFEDSGMKLFFVEKLRLILDVSGSMGSYMQKIRNEIDRLYNQDNCVEYPIQSEILSLNSDSCHFIFQASDEAIEGETIYFVSDYEIEGEVLERERARDKMIKRLKDKNQRLCLHSVKKDPTQEFKQVAIETGGWAVTNLLN